MLASPSDSLLLLCQLCDVRLARDGAVSVVEYFHEVVLPVG